MWEFPERGSSAPDLGVKMESTVPWRPLGKSNLIRSPWSNTFDPEEPYLPTEMSVEAARVGLQKATEAYNPFPEEIVIRAQTYVQNKLKSVWTNVPEDYITPVDEAELLLNTDKSPGYPYYYKFPDKGAVLADQEARALMLEKVDGILQGSDIPCYFTLTEKSELRPAEKVKAKKTRIFFASDVHHLVAAKVLFTKQNNELMEKIGAHPITLGIQMPGPQYVKAISKLGICNDGDISGCDLRYNLRLARAVRDIRANWLPTRYHDATYHLYNTVYCGYSAGLGGLYRVYGNKSGWENTSADNSFMTWLALVCACYALFPDLEPDDVFQSLINGDDLVVKMFTGHFKDMCDYLKRYNTVIEAEDWKARSCFEVVYLSHHLEWRFVQGFGDFVVAAGNLPKLLSSRDWVKRSKSLTFEESCVAHLLGVRLCLFPWEIQFEETDRILSSYLSQVEITGFMRTALSARLSAAEMFKLHTRVESFSSFPCHVQEAIHLVLKGQHRQIKESLAYLTNDTHSITKIKGKGKASSNAQAQTTRA